MEKKFTDSGKYINQFMVIFQGVCLFGRVRLFVFATHSGGTFIWEGTFIWQSRVGEN